MKAVLNLGKMKFHEKFNLACSMSLAFPGSSYFKDGKGIAKKMDKVTRELMELMKSPQPVEEKKHKTLLKEKTGELENMLNEAFYYVCWVVARSPAREAEKIIGEACLTVKKENQSNTKKMFALKQSAVDEITAVAIFKKWRHAVYLVEISEDKNTWNRVACSASVKVKIKLHRPGVYFFRGKVFAEGEEVFISGVQSLYMDMKIEA